MQEAYGLYFGSGNGACVGYGYSIYGMSVRPVLE